MALNRYSHSCLSVSGEQAGKNCSCSSVFPLRCHGLPFEVKVDEPNVVTYAAMEAAEKGEDMFGPFDSVGDLMEALNA